MVFKKFVEVGRVALINYGPNTGKLVVIVDIISTTKVLVDGPHAGVRRQELSIRRITLTEFKLDIPRAVKRDALTKAITDFKLVEKFKQSSFGIKTARRAQRKNNTDFDRFKVMILRQKRSALRGKALKAKK